MIDDEGAFLLKNPASPRSRLINFRVILITFFLMIIGIIGLWMIDTSVSALNTHNVLVNLFGFQDPAKVYHAGLLLVFFAICGLAFLVLYVVQQVHENKKIKLREN